MTGNEFVPWRSLPGGLGGTRAKGIDSALTLISNRSSLWFYHSSFEDLKTNEGLKHPPEGEAPSGPPLVSDIVTEVWQVGCVQELVGYVCVSDMVLVDDRS
jgi:hypothetical protein